MEAVRKEYLQKLGTLEGALDTIRPGDTIATGAFGNEPPGFLGKLHTIANRVERVSLWTTVMMRHYPVVDDISLAGKIDIITFFYSGACRAGHASGRYTLVPLNLHSVRKGIVADRRSTVLVIAVSPMDEQGKFYIAFDIQVIWEMIEAADMLILEVNPNIPKVYGETAIPLHKVDYIYEYAAPVPELISPPPSKEDQLIAENVASLVRDGDCIQLGIGGMPDSVGVRLLDKKELSIHTEMLTSSMGRLIKAGVVTNTRKNTDRGKAGAAFIWGDRELYELVRENPQIELHRAAYTNDPFQIAKNDNVVSVNTALQIDLTGQICSESIGGRQYSGTGGAADFAYGAYHSKNGRGIIAIHACAKNGTVSRIVPQLSLGAIVSISRNVVDYVVTEYGIAKLRDRTIRQRVENLIAVAAPEFRRDLRKQANDLLLW